MNLGDLSPELQEKVKSCESMDQVLQLAAEEGYDLDDNQLDAVSGGGFWDDCPDDCCINCRTQAICWGAGG